MLRQLRRQFILANMLLVFLVLLAVFGSLVLSTARQLEQESTAALELALRWKDRDGAPAFLFDLPEKKQENSTGSRRKQAVKHFWRAGVRAAQPHSDWYCFSFISGPPRS